MAKLAEQSDLIVRTGHSKTALLAAALVALGGLLLLALLIEPGSGVVDVQVPSGARPLVDAHRALLAPGEPWVVGRGIGRVPQVLAFVLQNGTLAAAVLGIWALVKQRKLVGWLAASYISAIQVAGPIPTTMQPEPPIAVSAAVARRLLADDPASQAAPWHRYMQAQIAYIDGDRAAAATLARGIDAEQLHSPIESRYRLQFLHGGPITITSVCFKFGCLAPPARRAAQVAALMLLIAGIVAAIGAGWLTVTLRRRIGRIDRMRARPARRVPA